MARKLLERNTANRNIAEIAFSVGFNDPKYFTRCFTKEFGVSPSAFGKN
jgi:AraC-like DNA-binding protein